MIGTHASLGADLSARLAGTTALAKTTVPAAHRKHPHDGGPLDHSPPCQRTRLGPASPSKRCEAPPLQRCPALPRCRRVRRARAVCRALWAADRCRRGGAVRAWPGDGTASCREAQATVACAHAALAHSAPCSPYPRPHPLPSRAAGLRPCLATKSPAVFAATKHAWGAPAPNHARCELVWCPQGGAPACAAHASAASRRARQCGRSCSRSPAACSSSRSPDRGRRTRVRGAWVDRARLACL